MTNIPPDSAYDAVRYGAPILEILAPERLRAAGLLHGWRGPETAAARLLEIGCGDGINAIAYAAANPQATVTAFDLSRAAIERGRALAAEAGVTNITLEVGDILTWPRDGEAFDYITSHGVLSWVPEPVRGALLDLIAARLAPGGIAYLSFDVLPGAASKVALTRFLRKHLKRTGDPAAIIGEVSQLLDMLDRTQSAESSLRGQIDFIRGAIEDLDPYFIFHDWLGEHYNALTLDDVGAALAQRGLQIGGSADCYDIRTVDLIDPAAAAFVEALGDDPVARLAAFDMLDGGRVFHRDLIVRSDAPPPAADDGITELSFSFDGRIEAVRTKDGPATRIVLAETEAVTPSPVTRAVLEQLARAEHGDVSFADLLAGCGLGEPVLKAELARLCSVLAVKAHAGPARFTPHPGERPRISALARAMLTRGNAVASLRGTAVLVGDEETHYCLSLCDGTRTRADVSEAFKAKFGKELPAALVDAAVTHFARRGLFEA